MRDLRSKTYSEKKKKKRKHVLILIPSILLCCIAIFLYYAFATRFHVSHIIVSGTSLLNKQDIIARVEEELSNTLWGFIPTRSPLFIGQSKVETILQQAFAPIDTVHVEIEADALFVTITERTSAALFCNADVVCFFLNKEGVIFAEAPHFEGSSYIKFVAQLNDYSLGQTVMTTEEVAAMIEKVEIFESSGLTLDHIESVTQEVIEFVDSNQTRFIMQSDDAPAIMKERLQAIVTSRPDVTKGRFEYIDMTIESKIFLKEKES